jgi:hypothetical protein
MQTEQQQPEPPQDVEVSGQLELNGPDRDEFYEATLQTKTGVYRSLSRSAIQAVAFVLKELGIKH